MITFNFAIYAVRDKNGNLDLAASTAKFQADIQTHFSKESADLDMVTKALHQIFDEHKGLKTNVPYLSSRVAAIMDANNPDMFTTIAERVKTAVQTNPAFASNRGRGGGTYRVCDQKKDEKAA